MISSWIINQLSSSIEIDNIIQDGEVIFKENHAVGLLEVSKLIDSAISKRQGDQKKHNFSEKKILHKRENGFTMNTKKYHITWSIDLWSNQLINFTKFRISKYLACNAKETLQLKKTKKRMNIAYFINIFTNIYTYIICDENDPK